MAAGRKTDGQLGSSCCIVWRGELNNEIDSQCLHAGSLLLAWFHYLLDHLDDFLLNNVNKDAISVGSTAMTRQFLACLRALCLAPLLRAKVIPIWRKTVFSSVHAVASENSLLPQELFLVHKDSALRPFVCIPAFLSCFISKSRIVQHSAKTCHLHHLM